ncbi:MAG: carboxylating nicotinate-nucleotide diphosphorylase [Dehalococcoidia bacterium]|nr:carboxylating nicotinate-nucleotide diphosphorylase [Dehalococcoidia bacterium]
MFASGDLLEGLAETVRRALAEDAADRDVTTQALVDAAQEGSARLLAKARGVLAGLPAAAEAFGQVDASLRFRARVEEGGRFAPGDVLATVRGSLAGMLRGERVALNFVQRLSGVATVTARYVAAVEGTGSKILDTRKTTPGLRLLEKYAVRMGGGGNHRLDLSAAVLIKDNHIAALRAQGMTLAEIVARARTRAKRGLVVEMEATSVAMAREAMAAGADMVLLDNMGLAAMRAAVEAARGRCKTEASGGMTLRRVRGVAETGVDYISVGALTHSARAVDMSLEFD